LTRAVGDGRRTVGTPGVRQEFLARGVRRPVYWALAVCSAPPAFAIGFGVAGKRGGEPHCHRILAHPAPKAEQFGLDRGGEGEYLIAQSLAWNL